MVTVVLSKQKKIIEQEFQLRNCKYWYDKVTALNTIEDFTPLIENVSWWKSGNNSHYTNWSESKPKTEYAWRCLKLWNNREMELEESEDVWSEYLTVVSDQARESLERQLPNLYNTIKSWNQN